MHCNLVIAHFMIVLIGNVVDPNHSSSGHLNLLSPPLRPIPCLSETQRCTFLLHSDCRMSQLVCVCVSQHMVSSDSDSV